MRDVRRTSVLARPDEGRGLEMRVAASEIVSGSGASVGTRQSGNAVVFFRRRSSSLSTAANYCRVRFAQVRFLVYALIHQYAFPCAPVLNRLCCIVKLIRVVTLLFVKCTTLL